MNKKLAVVLLVVLFIFSMSCSNGSKSADTIISIDDTESKTSENSTDDNTENENQDVDSEMNTEVIVKPNENEDYSKLNGNIYTKDELLKRPIVVSIDNHPAARAQAGLSMAEIVYEIEAEAPYTRYLAVFQTGDESTLIGPVRSARPYLIYLSLDYDSIFAHCGGSPEAFQKLKTLSVADVDGLYTSKMWRYNNTGKYAPHNLYTNIKSLREDAANKSYREIFDFEGFKFNDTDLSLEGDNKAEKVEIIYNKSNTTNYTYDEEKKLYIRQKDGESHIDENNNEQITAKNIIIYYVDKKLLDNEGRLYLGVVGKGKGYYITNGKYDNITWVKESEKSATVFYCGEQELKLNAGNTWVQVVSESTTVNLSE